MMLSTMLCTCLSTVTRKGRQFTCHWIESLHTIHGLLFNSSPCGVFDLSYHHHLIYMSMHADKPVHGTFFAGSLKSHSYLTFGVFVSSVLLLFCACVSNGMTIVDAGANRDALSSGYMDNNQAFCPCFAACTHTVLIMSWRKSVFIFALQRLVSLTYFQAQSIKTAT